MYDRILKICIIIAFAVSAGVISIAAQGAKFDRPGSYERFLDALGGMTVNEAVAAAINNSPELAAMHKEVAVGEALVRQAKLRANPTLDVKGTKQTDGPDNSFMIEGGIPLELAGRRGSRIRVAEQELEIRKLAAAERERQIASEVRAKFGDGLAAALKLKFIEEMLATATDNYDLVSAQVSEGRRAPLERNMELVELNRIRGMRETSEGEAEIKLLELRNLIGMTPDQPLKLRGELDVEIMNLPLQAEAIDQALRTRPDLGGAKAVERLSAARAEQARSEGRIDADVMLGYQKMRTGFPLSGYDETGMLMPIDMRSNTFTFGVRFTLPVFDRKQGMVAAAKLEGEAATKRREFGELTIRREVASAIVRYNSTVKAAEIFRVGVREQSAQNLDVIRQTYELGSKTLFDYIAELRRCIDAEMGYIEARNAAYQAKVEFMRAVNAPELIVR